MFGDAVHSVYCHSRARPTIIRFAFEPILRLRNMPRAIRSTTPLAYFNRDSSTCKPSAPLALGDVLKIAFQRDLIASSRS